MQSGNEGMSHGVLKRASGGGVKENKTALATDYSGLLFNTTSSHLIIFAFVFPLLHPQ